MGADIHSNTSVPVSSTNNNSPPCDGFFKVEKMPIFRIVDKAKFSAEKLKSHNDDRVEYDATMDDVKRKRGDLYGDDTGPTWHNMANPMITPPLFSNNLARQFKDLPISGTPECPAKVEECENKLLREFVGLNLDDTEYEELENYCNPEVLKTGKELKMASRVPVPGLISKNILTDASSDDEKSGDEDPDLCILKRLKSRIERDDRNTFPRCFKYRGLKLLPPRGQEDAPPEKKLEPCDLEPGKDTVFRVRFYRPYICTVTGDKTVRTRHSVFNMSMAVVGRQRLTELRDRFTCQNDLDLRLDMSERPDHVPMTSAKTMFPSGFLFINNVFYVDNRAGCRDLSAGVRAWAAARGLGHFPVRRMDDYTLEEVKLKLGHAEVYVHQGNCEHMFLVSELRLLARRDPLLAPLYPAHLAMSMNQTLYCTTCAEFGAKWLVADCTAVPFNPAFFCDSCFKLYLYKDGRKLFDFKAYAYRGNEIHLKSVIMGIL